MILHVGMPWTQADADAVRAAILALASGQRTVKLTYVNNGVTRSREWHQTDLKELRELLAEMESVATASTTGAYRLASVRKGLG